MGITRIVSASTWGSLLSHPTTLRPPAYVAPHSADCTASAVHTPTQQLRAARAGRPAPSWFATLVFTAADRAMEDM
jgi:hypothetical protein